MNTWTLNGRPVVKGYGDGVREVVYVGTRSDYPELDELIERFKVTRCVIDALPAIHATRDFANRHSGRVYMNYFQESQRGGYRWEYRDHLVYENRTEALDASRKVVRDRKVILPRAGKLMQEFADHMAADVKQLKEDEETGAQAFRYQRTGADHYSLAFTYDCIAWSRDSGPSERVWVGREDEEFYDPILHAMF